MSNQVLSEKLELAKSIYKRAFKTTFILAFMLSFISQYFYTYLVNHGIFEYMQSGGKVIPADFPSGEFIGLMLIALLLATIFAYIMIVLVQFGLYKQSSLNHNEAFKISLQMFPRKILGFIGVCILLIIFQLVISMFLEPIFRVIGSSIGLTVGSLIASFVSSWISVVVFIVAIPAVILSDKSVIESVKYSFKLFLNNKSIVVKIAFVIALLMMLNPIMRILLASTDTISMLMSIENIVITVIEALILPAIMAISIATYISLASKD